jgi:hypothetical protein
MDEAAARPPKAKNPNAPEAVRRRKRIQRVYTSVICIASTCSVSYALEMSAQADKNAAARQRATKLEAYLKVVQKHAADTQANFAKLTTQYNKVVSDAQRTQRRMLADLRKARSDARHATTASAAPVVYSSVTSFSGGGGSAATAAAASAPTTGSS